MALDEAPPFWWRRNAWQGWMLSPVGWAVGRAAATRMLAQAGGSVPVATLCVGNFIAGGAGKTPTVQMLVREAIKRGHSPGILSRGHGGAITKTTFVRLDRHNSHDVGDEALLHVKEAVTVVSTDRLNGARALLEKGCDLIIMDDGFQNPGLHKDFSLVVVDAERGIGNGFTMPAGPLRVPLNVQLQKADAVLLIGSSLAGRNLIRYGARANKSVFEAAFMPIEPGALNQEKVVAYAGIGNPEKFFATVTQCGAEIIERRAFGDHHVFLDEECWDLMEMAKKHGAQLVTTAKDAARLRGRSEAQATLLRESHVLEVTLQPDDPTFCNRVLDATFKKATKRVLAERKSPLMSKTS